MSSENIEFVKPLVNSSKEKKLTGVGVGLVILGLFGASQVPVNAAGTISNLRIDPDNSASIIWDGGPLPAFDLVPDDNRMALSRNGYIG